MDFFHEEDDNNFQKVTEYKHSAYLDEKSSNFHQMNAFFHN